MDPSKIIFSVERIFYPRSLLNVIGNNQSLAELGELMVIHGAICSLMG